MHANITFVRAQNGIYTLVFPIYVRSPCTTRWRSQAPSSGACRWSSQCSQQGMLCYVSKSSMLLLARCRHALVLNLAQNQAAFQRCWKKKTWWKNIWNWKRSTYFRVLVHRYLKTPSCLKYACWEENVDFVWQGGCVHLQDPVNFHGAHHREWRSHLGWETHPQYPATVCTCVSFLWFFFDILKTLDVRRLLDESIYVWIDSQRFICMITHDHPQSLPTYWHIPAANEVKLFSSMLPMNCEVLWKRGEDVWAQGTCLWRE